jgi:flagellar protein FliS
MKTAVNTYKRQSVMNASPAELVGIMYDEAIACTYRKDHPKLVKILDELIRSLNFDYELADDLYGLYEYCQDQARKNNYDEVRNLLEPIRSAWSESVMKKSV